MGERLSKPDSTRLLFEGTLPDRESTKCRILRGPMRIAIRASERARLASAQINKRGRASCSGTHRQVQGFC
jgi:hypothetical protein